jgi:lycopene cyclase CruP
VVQWKPLALTLAKQMVADPGFIPQILRHVGIVPILDWTRHFINLALYTALFKVFKPLEGSIGSQLSPLLRYRWQRTLEAWEYGSGKDYKL